MCIGRVSRENMSPCTTCTRKNQKYRAEIDGKCIKVAVLDRTEDKCRVVVVMGIALKRRDLLEGEEIYLRPWSKRINKWCRNGQSLCQDGSNGGIFPSGKWSRAERFLWPLTPLPTRM
jgi:hypothetical protein